MTVDAMQWVAAVCLLWIVFEDATAPAWLVLAYCMWGLA